MATTYAEKTTGKEPGARGKKQTHPTTATSTKARGRPPKGSSTPRFDSRLQIKLTPEGREKLDELVVRVGAGGVAEVVRDALRIYDIITEDVILRENQLLSRDSKTGEVERLAFWK